VNLTVEGPSIDATAPTVAATGVPVRIDFKATGVQIVKADGDASGKTGHIHVLVDKPLPVAGQPSRSLTTVRSSTPPSRPWRFPTLRRVSTAS